MPRYGPRAHSTLGQHAVQVAPVRQQAGIFLLNGPQGVHHRLGHRLLELAVAAPVKLALYIGKTLAVSTP